jgi:hypothetical protein
MLNEIQLVHFSLLCVFLRFFCFQCVSKSTPSCLGSKDLESAYFAWHLSHGQATSVWTPLNSMVKHYKLANLSVLSLLVTLGTKNVLSLVAFVPWSLVISNWGVTFHRYLIVGDSGIWWDPRTRTRKNSRTRTRRNLRTRRQGISESLYFSWKVVNPFTRARRPPFIRRRMDFYITILPLDLKNILNGKMYMKVFYIP